jgi:hypothetical protein
MAAKPATAESAVVTPSGSSANTNTIQLSTPMPAPMTYGVQSIRIPRTPACVVMSVDALIGSTR